mmetsp:Transcript_27462/g.44677  ORF Transcript_27462/g.44677 Transcript_27462/m.44677 type:complete len:171 (-) Transcript_27462:1336-1848(-)
MSISKITSASTSSDGLLVCAAEEEGGALHLWKIDYPNSTTIPIMKFQLGDFRGAICRFVPSRAPLFVDPNKPRKLNSDYKVIISGIEHLSQARRRGALVLVEFFDVHVHSDEKFKINGRDMRLDTDEKSSIVVSPQNPGRGMFQTRTMDLKNGNGNDKATFQVEINDISR